MKRVRELQARVGWCQLSDAIPGRSPVGFAAIAHAQDADGLAVVVEADAVVADGEAELGRVD